ncbi:glycine/D-amino acid oxidase-like deaminating enzyme [Bradyrhizobium sp. F1.4.3]
MPDALPDALRAPFGERLLEQLGRGPQTVFELIEKHDIECEVERAGTLHCAVGRKGLEEIEARAEQWQKRGAPVLVLNAEATHRKVGGGDYTGALLDSRAGTMQPLAYARGGVWDTREVLSSFRLDRSGRLVFGSVDALEGMGQSIHRAWAQRSLRKLFPGLRGVQFEAGWFGMIGMTSDLARASQAGSQRHRFQWL